VRYRGCNKSVNGVRSEDKERLKFMSETSDLSHTTRRRFLRHVVLLGIGTTLIAACGPSGASSAPTPAPAAQPTTPPAAAKPTTGAAAAAPTTAPAPQTAPARAGANLSGSITVSYPDEAGKKPPYVQAAADQVSKANPGAKITVDLQKIADGDYYTKLLLALQGGSGPDVTHLGGDSIGEMVDAGYLAPLDDYLAKWADWSQYPDAVKQGVTYKGKVYGIPYGLDTRFLYYRKDVFQKAGLDANWQPKNIQDIIDSAKLVQSKVPDVIPYALYAGKAGDTGTANHGFVPTLWAYGGDLQDKSGKWIGDSAALRKAFAYYQQAYTQAKLVPGEVLTSPKPWTAMREKEGNGGLALLFEGGWVYGGWADKDAAATKQNIGYVLFPTENAGPSFTVGGPGTVWMITSGSKNKDLAWGFIKTWNNKDTVAKLNIEDPHPVARTDSADVPEFKANQFLVDSTKSLEKARFTPLDAAWGKVITAIQAATERAATGDGTADDIVKRYSDDLKRTVGDDKVVSA
jgi:multiple sugar transport system substrate-binding protein